MKNLILLLLSFLTVYLPAFSASADFPTHSKSMENFNHTLQIVNVCSLRDQELNEIMLGNRPGIAIQFTASSTMPISLILGGNLFHLIKDEEKAGMIEIKQTFYARCVEQELIFSTNLTDWKPFLEFIVGTASITLSVQDGQPSIELGAQLNRRT